MAKDTYNGGIDPNSFLRQDEEEAGLIPNGGFGSPVRRRGKNRLAGGRDKLTMAEMKTMMSSMWREQYTYVEIAEKVNDEFALEGDDRIKPTTISYHIKSLLDSAKKRAAMHITERQALILARYDQIEWLATEAYFASMETDTINYERQVKKARSREREKQIADGYKRECRRVEKINKKRKAAHRELLPMPVPTDPVVGDLPDLLEVTSENIKEYERKESKPAGDPRWVAMLIDITDKKAKLFHLLEKRDGENPDQELAKLTDEERVSRLAAVLHAAKSRATGDKGLLAPPSPLGGFAEGDEPTPQPEPESEEGPEEVEVEVEWEFD